MFHCNVSSYFHQICYEDFDFVANVIQKRFEQTDYQIYVDFENLLIRSANNEEHKLEIEFYYTNCEPERLKLHI